MPYPENFTRGDIEDRIFRQAYNMACDRKSRIGILQFLKHSGVPQERAEEFADLIIAAGKKQRAREQRPHVFAGWIAILLGVGIAVAPLQSGWIATLPLTMIFGGIYWISVHKD